jgi:hypothetical protein
MSQLKLTADGGGGTVSLKGPSTTTGNAAIELTVPGTGNSTLATTATAGKVLQVKQTVKTDTTSTTNNDSFEDISGMSVTITPSATSSKILLMVDMRLSCNVERNVAYRLMRGSTQIYMGDAAGSRTRATGAIRMTDGADAEMQTEGAIYLDSPSTTSATTYKVQWTNTYHSEASYLNRPFEDTDNNDRVRAASSITVQEVAA